MRVTPWPHKRQLRAHLQLHIRRRRRSHWRDAQSPHEDAPKARTKTRRKSTLKADAQQDLEVAMLRILEYASKHPTMEWHPIRDVDATYSLALELLTDKGAVQIDVVRKMWKLWHQQNS
jgi:hypothetical protein